MSNSNNTGIPPLPSNFQPGQQDVVIGKGKKFYFHAGNQWLRTVVAGRIANYSQAVTKADKSSIISGVVDYVNENGRFVKLDSDGSTWIYAEPLLCREKCSQTFRDNLANTYRSSNVAKRNKRRAAQQEKTNSVISEMHFYAPADVPQAKRMRTSAPEPAFSFNTVSLSEPVSAPSNNSCATWFDWEMPLVDLEEPVDHSQEAAAIVSDLDGLLAELSKNDDFEPLPSLSGTVKPINDFSSSSIFNQQPNGFDFQTFFRKSAAAFAA